MVAAFAVVVFETVPVGAGAFVVGGFGFGFAGDPVEGFWQDGAAGAQAEVVTSPTL